MADELQIFLLTQAFADLVFLIAAFWCVRQLRGYRRMVQVMTADSPAVPTDPKLIEEWAEKYKNLPEGCPKWHAYRNRLFEVGYLTDGD